MGNTEVPWHREQEVPAQDVVAETKAEVTNLAGQVEQLSPVVETITAEIDKQPDSEKRDIFKMIGEGVEKLTQAIRSKKRSEAITWFTDLVKNLFSWWPGKPPYWKTDWNSWKWRESDFTTRDIEVLLAKLKSWSLSPEKKLSYARLISRRRDAECSLTATQEPEKTEEMLNFQAAQWRIKVWDLMIFGGPEQWWALKELALQAHVKDEMTHAAVVTSVDPLQITHATKQWVHTMSLMSYIANHQKMSYAVITGGGTAAATYATQQVGKKYDLMNAVGNKFGDDQTQFCSELAIRAFAEANGKSVDEREQEWKVFSADLLTLSYPTYVGDYPREDT